MEAPPTVIIRECCVINAGNNCLILFSNKVPVQLLTLVFIFSEISWIFPRSYRAKIIRGPIWTLEAHLA